MISTEIKKCFKGPLDNTLSLEELYKYFKSEVQSNVEMLKIGNNIVKFYSGLYVSSTEMYSEAFHHVTTKRNNRGIREPEERRFYINHIVPMIEHLSECKNCNNKDCFKIKLWTAPYNNKIKRTKILYICEDYNYLIILENDKIRKNQLNIVTSYLAMEEGSKKSLLEEYEKYKK